MRHADIDYSDTPELTDEELGRMVRVSAARLKAARRPSASVWSRPVLARLKRSGPGYQTRINKILREAMDRAS